MEFAILQNMLDIYRPEVDEHPSAAILSPYPFTGNQYNSAARLQAAANLSRVTWLGMARLGTNTTVFDLGIQQALAPTQYSYTMAEVADELHTEIDKLGGEYERLMGNGESGGGAPVMALALHGLFERIMLRDAIKVDAPRRTIPGVIAFLGYHAVGELWKPKKPGRIELPHITEPYTAAEKRAHGITEMRHYASLMLSTYTRATAELLARNPFLPIRYVGFSRSINGSVRRHGQFVDRLCEYRATAEAEEQAFVPVFQAADLHTSVEPRFHSDLMDPVLAAQHAKEMFALLPATKPF